MIEKDIIIKILDEEWNIRPAAKKLGIGYSTLRKYIKFHGIEHNSRRKKNSLPFNRSKYFSERISNFRKRRKRELLEYAGGIICRECGYDKDIPDVYEFHHLDPDKKDPSWYKMFANNHSIEKIKSEIDKCIVLCANCHREMHWKLKQK